MKQKIPGLSAKDALMRQKGKEFLDELKAQGPTYDKVGQSFVVRSTKPSSGTH